MRKLLTWVAIVVVMSGDGWDVNFASHPDNKAVQLTVFCYDSKDQTKLIYQSVNVREVGPDDTSVWFPDPRGTSKCHKEIEVVQFGDSPLESYVSDRYVIQ